MFIFDKTGSGASAKYKAWKTNSLVTFNELNGVDSELSFDINFGGTIERGECTLTGTAPDYAPAFTAASGDGE